MRKFVVLQKICAIYLISTHVQFVAHPNCQQHLTTIWYGAEMAFLQAGSSWKKFALAFGAVFGLPLLCLTYILFPNSKARA